MVIEAKRQQSYLVLPNNETIRRLYLEQRMNRGITGDNYDRDVLGRDDHLVSDDDLAVLATRIDRSALALKALNLSPHELAKSSPYSPHLLYLMEQDALEPLDTSSYVYGAAYFSPTTRLALRSETATCDGSPTEDKLTGFIRDGSAEVWFSFNEAGQFSLDMPTQQGMQYSTGGWNNLSQMRRAEYQMVEPFLTRYLRSVAQSNPYR